MYNIDMGGGVQNSFFRTKPASIYAFTKVAPL